MDKITLLYVGQRNKPFTVVGSVSGESYYVEPGGQIVIDPRDLEAIVAINPDVWQRVDAPTSKARVNRPTED